MSLTTFKKMAAPSKFYRRGDLPTLRKNPGYALFERASVRLLAVLAVLIVLSGLGPDRSVGKGNSPPAHRLIGVNMHPLQDNYAVYPARETLTRAKKLHASVVRIDIHWGWIEYVGPGTATWYQPQVQKLDTFLDEAARLHLRVLATVLDTPCWASNEPGRLCPPGPPHYHGSYPPTHPQDYADFLKRLVAHVGRRIQYYEIWNEPNFSHSWIHPDPVAYTKLLRAAYRAVKAKNPSSVVLAGATSGADVRFINGMYRAGAKGYFDALSIHPYSGHRAPDSCTVPRRSFGCGVEAVRRAMLHNGDTRPLWLTEFGAQSSGAGSQTTQAHYVTRSLSMITHWSYVRGAIWYELYDDPTGHDTEHYGLLSATLTPRAAAGAFGDKAGGTGGS